MSASIALIAAHDLGLLTSQVGVVARRRAGRCAVQSLTVIGLPSRSLKKRAVAGCVAFQAAPVVLK